MGMAYQTKYDRAASALSGSKLTQRMEVLVDPKALETCERLGLFHCRKRTGYTNPTRSQWIYDQMVSAIRKELAKKGLI